MSSSTPQQLMEECGLLFQIILKPQRDLGSLLLPVARECGCALRWHNTYEIWIKVRLKELCFFLLFFQWTIMCRNAILTNEEITVCRAGLETLYSYRGRLNWKLSYAQILHLTSNFNLKISADRLWMPKEWGAAIKKSSGNSLYPFNDSNHWNTSSWHHLQGYEPKADGKFHPVIYAQHFLTAIQT